MFIKVSGYADDSDDKWINLGSPGQFSSEDCGSEFDVIGRVPASSASTSDRRYLRCPPGVLMDPRRPVDAQRVTVFGSTPNSAATSAGVIRSSSPSPLTPVPPFGCLQHVSPRPEYRSSVRPQAPRSKEPEGSSISPADHSSVEASARRG